MKKILYIALLLIPILLLAFLKGKTVTVEDYLKYLENEKSRISKTKYVNGLYIKVKYLPAEYLAWKDLKGQSGAKPSNKDSILNYYKNSLCFLMTLGTDERKENKGDIMYSGVTEYKQYVERDLAMNFDMQQMVKLTTGGKEYKPVLSLMENIYSLDNKRNIMLVFTPADKSETALFNGLELDFEYNDQLFDMGVNHFKFSRKDIDGIPSFPF